MEKIVKFNLFVLVSFFSLLKCSSEKVWTDGYHYWLDKTTESISGPGSSLPQTEIVRKKIPEIVKQFNIKSILDAPCGDFYWMSTVTLGDCFYFGIDIIKPLIEFNKKRFSDTMHIFQHLDLTSQELPKVDLIICRDLLVHLSFQDTFKVINNFKQSKSTYLLTTFFSRRVSNVSLHELGWYPLNLLKEPFNFPQPVLIINENCTEQGGIYSDKSLGLWEISQLP